MMSTLYAAAKPRFWDNVIPLRPSLSGVQTAGWQPGPPVLSGLGCQLLADQRIPVADGVALAADVYTPERPGRYPAIVVAGAYSKELDTAGIPVGTNEVGCPPVFTDRGYAHLIVTRRGMGRSGGKAGVFFNDQDVDDIERVIAWAAAQPWCDGNVVMFGTSYYGMVQPQVAVRRPPALKAFFCNEICTDYFRHIVQFGGVPAVFFTGLWLGSNFTAERVRLHLPPLLRALLSQVLNSPLKPVWQRALRKRMNSFLLSFITNTPVRSAREWYVNWLVDGKARALNCIPAGPYAKLDAINIPFVVVQNLGFFNLEQFGSYDLFEHAATPADRKWLILGEAEYELPVYSWQLEALAFFDHVVRGADNGYAAQAPVRYWLDGAERFASATTFPIPGSTPVRLYLASSGADHATHALVADSTRATGSNNWAAVPLNAPLVGGFDEVANQTLTFAATMRDEVEFSGPVSAHLSFSCNEIDSYVVARVGRVDRAGQYHLLSMGAISPARRRIDVARSTACEIAIDSEVPEPLMPGEAVQLAFSLTPAPVRLQPGEKLRFDIASRTDLLKSDPSHGYVHFDLPVPPYFSRNTLHYGPQTYLELHRVSSGSEPDSVNQRDANSLRRVPNNHY